MKELFPLAFLLAILIPASTYWSISMEQIKEDSTAKTGDTLCKSRYSTNYPACNNQDNAKN